MYCLVRFLNGFQQLLTYQIPDRLKNAISIGTVILVPLQKRECHALVIALQKEKPEGSYQIKEIKGLARLPNDVLFQSFSELIAHYYFCSPTVAYERIYHALESSNEDIPTPDLRQDQLVTPTILTQEQQIVVDYLSPYITRPSYEPILLQGVTGSGKTEVYKRLILQAIHEQKTVLLLLPEVSLAAQFLLLFKQQLPSVQSFGFHSASTTQEKKILWQLLKQEKPLLIIGVHMPVFLPIARLGLIIIDEEHERGFSEKRAPYLNSKELALWRAYHYKIPILLGSATPSVSSWYNVEQKKWRLFFLTKRYAGAFPAIHKVILSQEKKSKKSFWISRLLEEKIEETLAKKEQIIIYLNRRGHSFFVQCKTCGSVPICTSCSVSLTYHTIHQKQTKNKQKKELLRCHYCDFYQEFSSWCNTCKAKKDFIKKGIGTQQGVAILETLFPHARIAQADLDSTKDKKRWQATIEAFQKQELDILVGTQTISKGYHFPQVTLVGVIWADLTLHFPFYHASETTLAQLIQVAGRAGRQSPESSVVIQTMQDHPIFSYLNETSYKDFCTQELIMRSAAHYPPMTRMLCIELRAQEEYLVEKEARQLYDFLTQYRENQKLNVEIKRPTAPPVHRINNWEIRHIFIKSPHFTLLKKLGDQIDKKKYKSAVTIIAQQL